MTVYPYATYFTIPLFDRTIIHDQSTLVSGDATHLTDGNLDTSWRGGTDSACYVIIDTCPDGEDVISGHYYGLWISNHATDFSGTYIQVFTSDDASDWTLAASGTWIELPEPLYFDDFSEAQGSRYYKFDFSDLPAFLELGQVFILTQRTPGRISQYPQYEIPEYINQKSRVGSGTPYISRMMRNPIWHIKRTYTSFTEEQADLFENIFNDCAGRAFPFIYHEDTDQNNPDPSTGRSWFCRMDRDRPQWSDVDSGVRRLTFLFTSLPWISDGYNY